MQQIYYCNQILPPKEREGDPLPKPRLLLAGVRLKPAPTGEAALPWPLLMSNWAGWGRARSCRGCDKAQISGRNCGIWCCHANQIATIGINKRRGKDGEIASLRICNSLEFRSHWSVGRVGSPPHLRWVWSMEVAAGCHHFAAAQGWSGGRSPRERWGLQRARRALAILVLEEETWELSIQ